MKNYLIKIILLISISKIIYAQNVIENEILFSVNDKIYTSVDLEIRKEYLKKINNIQNINLQKKLIINYKNLIIYDEYFKKNKNIKNLKKIVNEEYKKIITNTNIDKNDIIIDYENFLENIRLDLQRKIYIEKKLEKKREIIFTNDFDKINNIYNVEISFISLQNNNKDIINKIKKIKKLIDIRSYLESKKINFIYKQKQLLFTQKIDFEIKKAIINNENKFIIDKDKSIIIGEIKRIIKDTKNTKFIFFKLISKLKLNEEFLNCQKINEIKNNEINIKKLNEIDYKDLNEDIKKNINKINDKIKFKRNSNFHYLVLCEINYNNEKLEQININNKINYLAAEIESDFINLQSNKFKIIKYYE